MEPQQQQQQQQGEEIFETPLHPDADITPVGSPVEDLGFEDAPAVPNSETTLPSSSSSSQTVAPLTDDLRDKIIRQVEYYFSDENLPTDKFLMKYVKRNKQGFVPISLITSFRKMKKLVQDSSHVVAALKESSQLALSSDGKKVKRIRPLPVTDVKDAKVPISDVKDGKGPHTDVKDAKSRTVFVENLPENYSVESLQKIFRDAGSIKNISIRDPHAIEGLTNCSKSEMIVSGKVHALVEYETMEAAEKAVATLNDEKNWRSGLRVELLIKWTNKYGVSRKGWKGTGPEKNVSNPSGSGPDKNINIPARAGSEKNPNAPACDTTRDEQNSIPMDHNERPDQEDEEHLPGEKNGRRSRNRGRARGHKPNHTNAQGHGQGYGHSASSLEVLSKPPPGPKMPDGTKGFAMGRGRPLISNHN